MKIISVINPHDAMPTHAPFVLLPKPENETIPSFAIERAGTKKRARASKQREKKIRIELYSLVDE